MVTEKERFYFNIIAEAKMNTFVDMTLKYVPRDQAKQFCEVMLARALKQKGVQ